MVERGAIAGRLVPYWVVVASSVWILAFLYAWTNDPGSLAYETFVAAPVRSRYGLERGFWLRISSLTLPSSLLSGSETPQSSRAASSTPFRTGVYPWLDLSLRLS